MHIYLFTDITMVHKEEKLKLETKFKNIFLSSMSHNLKTPINSKIIIINKILAGLVLNNEILMKRITPFTDKLSAEIVQKDHENLLMLNLQVCDILVWKYNNLIVIRIFPGCIQMILHHSTQFLISTKTF